MNIRNSAKAIIIKDGKVLCIKCEDTLGFYYGLPGGGQEHGESLPEAVRRECREEIGADVIVRDLVFVRDYIGANHEFAQYHPDMHQVELMFACDLVCDCGVELDNVPDTAQIGVEWLELDKLENYRLYPQEMRPFLKNMQFNSKTTYLGDIN